MTRPLRIEFPQAVYHVMSRGNAHQEIFVDDVDRNGFLQLLGEVVERCNWLCHAYCLMTNHYHLLIETPHANLSSGMHRLNGVYTQRFNRRHNRVGHLFQGRYKAILVEKESYLLEVARYIVLNPVRTQLVAHPRDWKWSSYRATAGEEEIPKFLTTDWIWSQFHENRHQATVEYQKFVNSKNAQKEGDKLRWKTILGSEQFLEKLKPLLRKEMPFKEIPRKERLVARPSLEELFAGVENRAARNEKIYQAVWDWEYSLREVADYLGLHYSTVSVLVKRVREEKHKK